jgi:hypothetical protein
MNLIKLGFAQVIQTSVTCRCVLFSTVFNDQSAKKLIREQLQIVLQIIIKLKHSLQMWKMKHVHHVHFFATIGMTFLRYFGDLFHKKKLDFASLYMANKAEM